MLDQATFPEAVLVVGLVTVLALLSKNLLRRAGLPSLVAFIALGFLLRFFSDRTGLLHEGVFAILEFLAKLGVFSLLFRIGLDSDLPGLLRQLRRAGVIWAGNVAASGVAGYAAARYVLGLGLVPSLFAATALTATSIGIAVGIWRDAGTLDSETGELMLDVAELDDISGVVFMAILFGIVPALRQGAGVGKAVAVSGGLVLLKLTVFAGGCVLFARFVEERLTTWASRLSPRPDPMITLVAVSLVIAGIAGLLGFSLAIGAFFAGLVFSRDPRAVRIEASFDVLYDLFVPFFFVGLGTMVTAGSVGGAVVAAGVLLAAAVVGKLVGTFAPAVAFEDRAGAGALALSMVPRAEITMLIMSYGRSLGEWAVPPMLYTTALLTVAATALGVPPVLLTLLRRLDRR
jgi:Kef-type K+ transport system membrane component KefB